ncbi:hypothetical protein F0562_025546 [Nyssa sinensis]|uniref:Uncharacterized protein n=1 Tax=Nyssa sinensis TaxID=561372 RepID=A0A5J5B8C1_9ASTE|nr:hypothetical protein F0562_025546 [Nyssa sinensis]
MEECRQESRQNGSVTSGIGLALRAGHGGPSPEPISCRWTARATHVARAGHCMPAEGWTGNGSLGAFPGRRTVDSELLLFDKQSWAHIFLQMIVVAPVSPTISTLAYIGEGCVLSWAPMGEHAMSPWPWHLRRKVECRDMKCDHDMVIRLNTTTTTAGDNTWARHGTWQ